MTNPEICVLKTDGTNCDMEMAHALETAGGRARVVHINELRSGVEDLRDYGGLAIPGGFSYGDDVASGKILANELTSYLSDQITEFVDDDKPVIGICNGFQVLVRTGLLPEGTLGRQSFTLAHNRSGRFECRWIDLIIGETVCKFTQSEDLQGVVIPMQTAHGEGRFVGSEQAVSDLGENGQVVFRYASPSGEDANGQFPFNPNGSMDDIAGVCDPTGLVLGMMPHPERSITAFHPERARTDSARSAAQMIFNNFVQFAKEA